jgi:cell division protein FtsB
MTKRVDPKTLLQADGMTVFPARPPSRRRLLLAVLAIVLVAFGLALWIIDKHTTDARLRQAATCRGVTYEEAKQTATEIAETAHVSLSDAARMVRHLACVEADGAAAA